MLNILSIFLDILSFKKGPQDLPTSAQLLNIIIVINIIVSMIPSNPDFDFSYAGYALLSLVYIGATLLFIQLSLNMKDKASDTNSQYGVRYIQVSIAMLGVHAIIGFVTSFISLLTQHDKNIIVILIMIATLYTWIINGHIFKNAFDKSMFFGLGISFLYSMITGSVMLLFLQIFVS
ncbi:MAG: hypothetical protein VYE31_01380 [Pseudomonadota bacterium]|nr:hypothetical protein [Pseudomonadota bacterium]